MTLLAADHLALLWTRVWRREGGQCPTKHLVSCLAIVGVLASGSTGAGEVRVAVASNFAAPMQKVAAAFARDTGHTAILSLGSTAKFYAQIHNGAPFEVFLSADDETPTRLESQGKAVAGSRYTYALGRLALWSKKPGYVDAQGAVLRLGTFDRLALADPKLAPYGAAAVEVLRANGLLQATQAKWVLGESIGQAYQFVATGNAPLGFVSLSQIMQDGQMRNGSAWVVPASLHQPLRQDAVLLNQGRSNPAARALLDYLRSEKARALMASYGYEF